MIGSKTGPRNTSLVVQRETPTKNRLGQNVPTWSTVYGTPSPIMGFQRALSGREAMNAQQTKAVVTFVVEIDYLDAPTIGPKDRLLVNGQPYNVEWVNNVDARNRKLLIYCTEPVTPTGT